MTMNFRYNTVCVTHAGLVRSVNEDAFLDRGEVGLWAVADGMGGHENGRWASTAVVAALGQAALEGDLDADTKRIADAIHAANATIQAAAETAGRRMGSTVVALRICGVHFQCYWAGDSRIYLLRGGQLVQLTRDHTQVEDMVERGLLTRAEAWRHPMSHVLSRAVGVEPELQLDAVVDVVEPRDLFLLCSDGLTGFVSEAELSERLDHLDPRTACKHLLELVLSRGASDNLTMVAVLCEEATMLSDQVEA